MQKTKKNLYFNMTNAKKRRYLLIKKILEKPNTTSNATGDERTDDYCNHSKIKKRTK